MLSNNKPIPLLLNKALKHGQEYIFVLCTRYGYLTMLVGKTEKEILERINYLLADENITDVRCSWFGTVAKPDLEEARKFIEESTLKGNIDTVVDYVYYTKRDLDPTNELLLDVMTPCTSYVSIYTEEETPQTDIDEHYGCKNCNSNKEFFKHDKQKFYEFACENGLLGDLMYPEFEVDEPARLDQFSWQTNNVEETTPLENLWLIHDGDVSVTKFVNKTFSCTDKILLCFSDYKELEDSHPCSSSNLSIKVEKYREASKEKQEKIQSVERAAKENEQNKENMAHVMMLKKIIDMYVKRTA